jgi:cytochrome c biogenesis protein CcmG/thiol:disulfide interchange protein DsbE
MEFPMKRTFSILGVLAFPILAAHLVFAAGLFKVGEKAPSFALTAITGETLGLDTYKGKVVVLGLFHICEPCLIQGTALQKVSEMTKGKDVVVLGVNSSGDSKKNVGEFLSAFPVKVTYPYLLDPNKVTDKLYGGGKFIPNVYVIDQQGVIRWQRV